MQVTTPPQTSRTSLISIAAKETEKLGGEGCSNRCYFTYGGKLGREAHKEIPEAQALVDERLGAFRVPE
jgi:hypothetical protein